MSIIIKTIALEVLAVALFQGERITFILTSLDLPCENPLKYSASNPFHSSTVTQIMDRIHVACR